jgi:hypothetical protein
MVGVIDANLVVVSEFLPCDVDVHWHLQTFIYKNQCSRFKLLYVTLPETKQKYRCRHAHRSQIWGYKRQEFEGVSDEKSEVLAPQASMEEPCRGYENDVTRSFGFAPWAGSPGWGSFGWQSDLAGLHQLEESCVDGGFSFRLWHASTNLQSPFQPNHDAWA